MATYTNQTKTATTFANEQFSSSGLTWDEATFTWDEATGTWNNPFSYNNQGKNTSSFTNETKN